MAPSGEIGDAIWTPAVDETDLSVLKTLLELRNDDGTSISPGPYPRRRIIPQGEQDGIGGNDQDMVEETDGKHIELDDRDCTECARDAPCEPKESNATSHAGRKSSDDTKLLDQLNRLNDLFA